MIANMKKTFLILLMLALIFSAFGCGNDAVSDPTETSPMTVIFVAEPQSPDNDTGTCGLQKFHPGRFLVSTKQKAACR